MVARVRAASALKKEGLMLVKGGRKRFELKDFFKSSTGVLEDAEDLRIDVMGHGRCLVGFDG